MPKISRRAIIALSSFSLSFLTGCAAASTGSQSPDPSGGGTVRASVSPEMSVARHYSSLVEVAEYSTDIVEGVVVGQPAVVPAAIDPGPDDTAKATVSSFEVIGVIGGDLFRPGDVIPIHQLGTVDEPVDKILQANQSYVLYLEPFYFVADHPTGQYVIVGDASVAMATNLQTGRFRLRDMSATSRVDVSQLKQTAKSLGRKATPN